MPRSSKTDKQLHRTVGNRLRRARTAQEMTQEQLVEELGIQPETVSRYETGSIPVSLTGLFRLAEKLDVPVDALLPIEKSSDRDNESELLERWRLLDKKGQSLVLDILRRMNP